MPIHRKGSAGRSQTSQRTAAENQNSARNQGRKASGSQPRYQTATTDAVQSAAKTTANTAIPHGPRVSGVMVGLPPICRAPAVPTRFPIRPVGDREAPCQQLCGPECRPLDPPPDGA